MILYVCGFHFSEDLKQVVLIRKQKPEWQKGKLNGVGGKIEDNEHGLGAMIREFKEETDKLVTDWKPFYITGDNNTWLCYFYLSKGNFDGIKHGKNSIETEQVEIHNVADINMLPVIDNLMQLIPQALSVIDKKIINPCISFVN